MIFITNNQSVSKCTLGMFRTKR